MRRKLLRVGSRGLGRGCETEGKVGSRIAIRDSNDDLLCRLLMPSTLRSITPSITRGDLDSSGRDHSSILHPRSPYPTVIHYIPACTTTTPARRRLLSPMSTSAPTTSLSNGVSLHIHLSPACHVALDFGSGFLLSCGRKRRGVFFWFVWVCLSIGRCLYALVFICAGSCMYRWSVQREDGMENGHGTGSHGMREEVIS